MVSQFTVVMSDDVSDSLQHLEQVPFFGRLQPLETSDLFQIPSRAINSFTAQIHKGQPKLLFGLIETNIADPVGVQGSSTRSRKRSDAVGWENTLQRCCPNPSHRLALDARPTVWRFCSWQ